MKRTFLPAVVLVLIAASARGAIPQVISFQGRLADSAGAASTTAVDVMFALYDVETGGTPIWTETHAGLDPDDGGLFSALLGAGTTFASQGVDFTVPLWLGVTVGTDAEMTPRFRLAVVPYAMRAASAATADSADSAIDADTVDGLHATDLAADYVDASGDTMTGALVLSGDPTTGLHAATKQYVDAAAAAGGIASVDGVTNAGGDVDFVPGTGILVTPDDAGDTVTFDADIGGGSGQVAAGDHDHDIDYVNLTGDTMTGALNLPADGLVAGTDQLVVAGGNVGIGTAAPAAKLEIHGADDGTNEPLAVYNDNGNPTHLLGLDPIGNGWLLTWQDDGSIGMAVNGSTGNVGVGTMSPAERLHVRGAGYSGGAARFESTDDANLVEIAGVDGAAANDIAFLTLDGGEDGKRAIIGVTGTAAAGGAGHLRFLCDSGGAWQETMRIQNDGDVGIGAASPNDELHIARIDDVVIRLEADTDNAVSESDNPAIVLSQDAGSVTGVLGFTGLAGDGPEGTAYGGTTINALLLGTTSAWPVELGANGAVHMTVASDGNVGIGTTAPTAKLDVAGALRVDTTVDPPNIIGGYSGNSVTAGSVGVTLMGGTGDHSGTPYPNVVTDNYGTVGGGMNNRAGDDDVGNDPDSAIWATVAGGLTNTAAAIGASVGGGTINSASGDSSTVAGGSNNEATGNFSVVSGGSTNIASGLRAVIAGGRQNSASNEFSTIGGGYSNDVNAMNATICGGNNNLASGGSAAVGGGYNNTASGLYATVGGGNFNVASGPLYSTVGGGNGNTAGGSNAFVGGGHDNTADGETATVGGGNWNEASDYSATVGGGWSNIADGYCATIPGGYWNSASGEYCFAAGLRAKALHNGAFVWADSTWADFSSTANDQFLIRASGGVGVGTASPSAALDVESATGIGVRGEVTATDASYTYGVWGESSSTNGRGVIGKATAATGTTYAVVGQSDSTGGYDFYAAGADSVDYGTFTGAHEVLLAKDFPAECTPGLIVSVTGQAGARLCSDGSVSLSSTMPTVRLSYASNDPAVFGVLHSEVDLPDDHWFEASEGQRFANVNAVGEGRVWVSEINGDIRAGDYLTTSEIPGYAQRQEDGVLRNYTLGKAIETVDWDTVTRTVEHGGREYKVYLIAVIYTSG